MNKKLLALFLACFLPSAMFAGSGDANNDGKVDVADIVEIISNYILKTRSDLDRIWTDVNVDVKKIWADANVDGKIDMEDVKTIADYLIMTEAERQNRGKALNEVTAPADLGKVIASDGKVYPAGTIGITPVAMIVYVGSPGTADCNSETYRGLAIALSDVEKNGESTYLNIVYSETQKGTVLGYKSVNEIIEADVYARDGLAVPVPSYSVTVPQGNVTSGWFMPSAGQYIAFYKAYGLSFDKEISLDWRSFGVPEYDEKNARWLYKGNDAGEIILGDLRKAGDTTVNINNYSFWTCSPTASYSKNGRVIFTDYISGGTGFSISNISPQYSNKRIRPFLAF